jgi:hypothetical protein
MNALCWIAMSLVLALVACRTTPAPAFKGRWQPVNRFPATTQAIPIDPPYVFYASPMDGTLRQMLERWAKDAGMSVTYQHTVDFTLHADAARIRAENVPEALALLKSAYAAQRLEFAVENGRIVVRPMWAAVVRTVSGTDTESTP